jgi:hypothetical protein
MDRFNSWLGAQPALVRVVTCGNHEYPVEAEPDKWRKRLTNATLLLNGSITIEGIKLWSSPVTPLQGGASGISDEAERETLWRTIPNDTEILVTHGPPQGILDGGQGCPKTRGDPGQAEAPLLRTYSQRVRRPANEKHAVRERGALGRRRSTEPKTDPPELLWGRYLAFRRCIS